MALNRPSYTRQFADTSSVSGDPRGPMRIGEMPIWAFVGLTILVSRRRNDESQIGTLRFWDE